MKLADCSQALQRVWHVKDYFYIIGYDDRFRLAKYHLRQGVEWRVEWNYNLADLLVDESGTKPLDEVLTWAYGRFLHLLRHQLERYEDMPLDLLAKAPSVWDRLDAEGEGLHTGKVVPKIFGFLPRQTINVQLGIPGKRGEISDP